MTAVPLRNEWRAGWRPLLAAVIGMGTCIGVWSSVSSLFIEPLQRAFGWSRGQLVLAYNALIVRLLRRAERDDAAPPPRRSTIPKWE